MKPWIHKVVVPTAAAIGTVATILAAASSMGMTMPWQAPTRTEVKRDYVQKDAFEEFKGTEKDHHDEVMQTLRDLNKYLLEHHH